MWRCDVEVWCGGVYRCGGLKVWTDVIGIVCCIMCEGYMHAYVCGGVSCGGCECMCVGWECWCNFTAGYALHNKACPG